MAVVIDIYAWGKDSLNLVRILVVLTPVSSIGKTTSLFGLLACHVDDMIWGGDEMFKTNMINKLKHTFQFGCEEIETFTYIGLVSIKTII